MFSAVVYFNFIFLYDQMFIRKYYFDLGLDLNSTSATLLVSFPINIPTYLESAKHFITASQQAFSNEQNMNTYSQKDKVHLSYSPRLQYKKSFKIQQYSVCTCTSTILHYIYYERQNRIHFSAKINLI